MSAPPDESTELTVATILQQGGATISRNVAALVANGHDPTTFLALIHYASETPSVRVFNVRLIPIKDYAEFIAPTYPEVADAVKVVLPAEQLRVVLLFDGFVHVTELPLVLVPPADAEPLAFRPVVNARGGGVA